MKTRLLPFVVFLLVAGPAAAEPLLWQVEGSRGTAYLFGSIHVAPDDVYPLPSRVERAFDVSDVVVVEADVTGAAGMDGAMEALARGVYPPDDSLENHLPRSLFRKVSERMSTMPLPFPWQQTRPWLLATTLTMTELQRIGFHPEKGIETHFLGKLGEKEVVELESIGGQLELLAGLEEKQQVAFLEQTLEDLDDLEAKTRRMISAWQEGDPDSIEKLLLEPFRKSAELEPPYRKLFTDRNRAMAKKIRGLLDDRKTYFVIVGAGHLVGTESVVDLLDDHHPVERLTGSG